MKANKLLSAAIFASAIAVPSAALAENSVATSLQLPVEGEMASLGGATGWLNSPPMTAAGLRGKVVLVDFWTYTCINWLRTEPYVRAWAEKYKNQGLVVIGVQTPEFAFEHDVDNVRRAVKDIRKYDRALAEHLQPPRLACGRSPCYRPDRPMTWEC